jgi:hypothetical protein
MIGEIYPGDQDVCPNIHCKDRLRAECGGDPKRCII